MKFLSNTQILGIALLLSVLLISGCMTEDSSTTDPLLPEVNTELKNPDLWPNPLDNLRLDPSTLKMLAELRQATVQYHDINVALEAGYEQGSECVSSPSGAMGFHYVNFGWVDGEYDPYQPEALLYEMDQHGKMHLVGVEFVVVADLWDLENEMIPNFGVQEFDEAFPPAPLPFRNYQLHVWVWKGNPNGIFTKFNPNVKCN
ncbi:hypothetical protein [Algoriphagus sp. AK58]|uniref:hypothetical protein n=1 Tax=Algoriphagus sp. AK58 TaxID=1406877 RepID=UPI00164F4E26|nr:hypothetical protein [Algoriphagus sp. AK58]